MSAEDSKSHFCSELGAQSSGESSLFSLYLGHESEDNATAQGLEDDFVPHCSVLLNYHASHLGAVQCHIYNNASCQQITQSSCLFRENTNCTVVLCCSEVGVPCCRDKVCTQVLSQRQLTDALSRTGVAPGLTVGARLHPCIPQWNSSTEVKRSTMNHKLPTDL